jgi:KaiC/GvpD/RAD55 family RecA-like ATPase
MGIKVDIEGLDKYIPEIKDGHMILIEGRLDPIKTYFVQHLGCIASRGGRKVVFVTSRVLEEMKKQFQKFDTESIKFEMTEERSARHWKDFICENSLLIVDSFSYLMLDKSLYEFRDVLEDLRHVCVEQRAVVLLTIVDGMLGEKEEITTEYLSDGIIRFLTREYSKGITRFIQIPKWMGRIALDENIHYTFDGKKMHVDTRSRVV